ncbi:MAG: hypothetical protein MUF75_04775 [Bacteroidia bacterium]|jgi:hypothetical protein|nr:hypothetical protein [Bacteroidia bacterium]
MAKVTYIIGAGASANALPTNQNLPDSLEELANSLRADSSINTSFHAFRDSFCLDLEWLAKEGREYITVDTFASYCHIKDRESLQKLKFTLSLYFTIQQFVRKKTDNRYRNFLLKLVDSRQLFPENIKILNWNYDTQFQIAASVIRQEDFTYVRTISKHTPPLIEYYHTLGGDFNVSARMDHIELTMVHLNGIAGYYFYEQTQQLLNYNLGPEGIRDINDLFEKVNMDGTRKHPILSFAFEPLSSGVNHYTRNRIPYAKKIVSDTEYLVVIGYSFPIDNFDFDCELFSAINSGNLKGIYYQDPVLNVESMRTQFKIDESIFIKHIAKKDTFHIPIELKL